MLPGTKQKQDRIQAEARGGRSTSGRGSASIDASIEVRREIEVRRDASRSTGRITAVMVECQAADFMGLHRSSVLRPSARMN